jgi:hypothetical protein
MSSQQGESPQEVDAWTGMQTEQFEDAEFDPIVLPTVVSRKPKRRLDIKELLWKYVASGSSHTAAEVLSCLAGDSLSQIRRRCAENPSAGADTLAILAKDPLPAVRAAVARNERTPIYILRNLAEDADVHVRFSIASNVRIPDAILLSLFMDADPYVAERASQTLGS